MSLSKFARQIVKSQLQAQIESNRAQHRHTPTLKACISLALDSRRVDDRHDVSVSGTFRGVLCRARSVVEVVNIVLRMDSEWLI